MTASRSNFVRGFTLLELILVLAIIAILVSVSVPAIATFEKHQRPRETADNIVAIARWTRTQSITRGVSYRLNVSGDGHYFITVQNGPSFENVFQDTQSGSLGLSSSNAQTTTMFNAVGEDVGKQFVAPEGVRITCNFIQQPDGQYVEFRPTGRCDPGTITITDGVGAPIEIGSLTATEEYHVLSADEKQMESSQPISSAPGSAAR